MPEFIDISGRSFGRWTALFQQGSKWRCRCACGREKDVEGFTLRNGRSQSCGCLRAEQVSLRNRLSGFRPDHTTHGMRHTREYETWCNMIERCENPKSSSYKYYGGRGITMCERWRESFSAFYADMGDRPAGTSIDRIDNNGHYTPDNCRWSSRLVQSRNRRNVKCHHT